ISSLACSSSSSSDGGDASTTGDSSSGDGAVVFDAKLPDGAPFDYCSALSDRAAKCGGEYDPAKCAATVTCANRAIKAEDRGNLLVCLATRECTASEDTCVGAVSAKYKSDP